MTTHILSVDVEDYFQVEAFAAQVPRSAWAACPSRVEANTLRLLDLFDEHGARATFFTLGWVARRFPRLVRAIAARGHELACHSFWHRPVYTLTPAQFHEDTRDALDAIQNAAGARVAGYRAPTWSITRGSLWALPILAELGFRWDSSIFPIRHDLYGIPGARRTPYAWRHAGGFLFEFPPATVALGGRALPAAGGGYLRALPLAWTHAALAQPAVVYLHPWEIDPAQPRIAAGTRSRLRHYTGLDGMEAKLRVLLARYRFRSFAEAWRELSVDCPSLPMPSREAAA